MVGSRSAIPSSVTRIAGTVQRATRKNALKCLDLASLLLI
jgi:hypothetical protein